MPSGSSVATSFSRSSSWRFFSALTGTIAWKGKRPIDSASSGNSFSRSASMSVLLIARITRPDPSGRSCTTASSSARQPVASMTSTITSTSASAPFTCSFMRLFSAERWRRWKPGVSTKMYWASASVRTPSTRSRVVCGLRDVMLTRSPTSAFTRVDLPTFGRPMTATMPTRRGASCSIVLSSGGLVGRLDRRRAMAFGRLGRWLGNGRPWRGRLLPRPSAEQRHRVLGRFEGLLRRRLLGGPAAAPVASHADVEFRDRALDLELLVVRGAAGFDDGVHGQRDPLALQVLLQLRLAVLAEGLGIDGLQHRIEELADRLPGGVEAAVDEDGAEDGLHRVGEDRRP